MRRNKWTIALLLWLTSITITSHGRVDSRAFVHTVSAGAHLGSEASFASFWASWWWLFVKGWHVVEFLILTLLINANMRRCDRIAWAILCALAFACFDEWHQTFIPFRGGRISDVGIDSIGIATAALGTCVVQRRAKQNKLNASTLQNV